MNKVIIKIILAITAFLQLIPEAQSVPVRNRNAIYTQPDGSTFAVTIRGDEWTKIRTTEDGCTIIKDKDNWWCYGIYDENAVVINSGYRVGQSVPSDIVAKSRQIPYELLSQKATSWREKTSSSAAQALEETKTSLQTATKSSTKTVKRGIAILAQFTDVKFTHTKEDIHKLLNQEGYNNTGSAKDYYQDQFGDNWEFIFDVSEIVTLPNTLKYYGQNSSDKMGSDLRPAEMARDACKAADDYVNFSLYDMNEDGEVDNVYIFYAGHDESENTEDTDLLWAHQYYIFSGGGFLLECDGVKIDRYACSSELSGENNLTGIGTFCHEFMHTFGVPDFYDTDYDTDGSWAAGLWRTTSLMDGGNYNNNSATPPNLNCIERKILGLSEPIDIQCNQSYIMEPIHKNGQYYRMESKTEGEYYLVECRSNDGWDKYIGGRGMLVYHIDERPTTKWKNNTVNTDPYHQCVDLIEADGRTDIITDKNQFRDIQGIFYPQENITSLIPETIPSYILWDGHIPEISLIGIRSEGDDILFSSISTAEASEFPIVIGFNHQNFPDAIYVEFESSRDIGDGTVVIEWNKSGKSDISSATLQSSPDGKYSYLIEGLEGGNTLYEVKIHFAIEGVSGHTHKTQIFTKKSPDITWPYISFSNNGKINKTEGMVAHVINADKAKEIEWKINDKPLTISHHHIYPQESGTLSCNILWEDGSTDTILKEITVTE